MEELKKCWCCGCELTEENIKVNPFDKNEFYCEDCFDETFEYCEICDRIEYRDDLIWIESEEIVVCQDCFDDEFTRCHCCDEILRINSRYTYWSDSYDDYFCEYCFMDRHTYCEECDTWVDNDDYNFDCECCCDCAEENEHNGKIGSYHSHNYIKVGSPLTSGEYFKGIELEIENKKRDYYNEQLSEKLYNDFNNDITHIYFEHDGSLSNGFEIITHPHTLKEFYDIDWSMLLNTCKEYGFRSHDTSTCGLHIHYSREWFGNTINEQEYNTAKLLMFYELHSNDFLKLSRRTEESFHRWADMYYTNGEKEKCESIVKGCCDRYKYINFCKSNTIEFRLGRGTLNYNSFMAWNKIHDLIVRNIKTVSFDDMYNYKKWFNGIDEDTLNYIKEKNVFVDFWN